MRSLLDLSFRYKLPLWGSLLIIIATLAASASLMFQAYDNLRTDLVNTSASLGRTLAEMVYRTMPHDDVWHTFEFVHAPFHETPTQDLIRPEMILVLDNTQQVFVSSHPKIIPMLADFRKLGPELAEVGERIAAAPASGLDPVVFTGEKKLYVATPVAQGRSRLGTVVIVHSKDVFLPRFRNLALRGAAIGLLVLGVLLPISWYWGRRTAGPLMQLAHSADQVARGHLEELPTGTYAYRDELGRLYDSFAVMVKALREKVLLEREMVRSERLAAIGRLAAGMAHEINNPLGGMLGALDNFKRRNGHDQRALKTASMIERGLTQIHETVGAMLVETKVKSRNFLNQDILDIMTLLSAELTQRAVTIDMDRDSRLDGVVALPATPIRQILMNVLLNAVQASQPGGTVRCRVHITGGSLYIETENKGRPIPPEVMDRLFEPFASGNEAGQGLGLWVTYQIVSQLGGRIRAECSDQLTRFFVVLPIGGTA